MHESDAPVLKSLPQKDANIQASTVSAERKLELSKKGLLHKIGQ